MEVFMMNKNPIKRNLIQSMTEVGELLNIIGQF